LCTAVTTHCIIVCYRPGVAQLMTLCERVRVDRAKVILVDNTETPYLDRDNLPEGCTLVTLGYNSGIAHAQNVGVAEAISAGATVLIFFDQDSKIDPGFVPRLVEAIEAGVPDIVSPLCVDDDTGTQLPSARVNRYGLSTPVHPAGSPVRYPADIVISSGTAATREVFDLAGTFDEDFFIDYVDIEWCLRCRGNRIPIHIVPGAVMRHSIGTRAHRLGPLTILVHSPTRCYYQIRNSFLLLRKRHVPIIFSLKQIASVILSRMALLIWVRDRPVYLKAYLSGLRDGLNGVTGAKPL
jgi:rhamnosyltransferase